MGFPFPGALASNSLLELSHWFFNQSNKKRKLKQSCSRKLDAPNLKKVKVVENEAILMDLKDGETLFEAFNSIIGTEIRDKKSCLDIKEAEMQQLVRQAKDNAEEIKPTVVDWLKRVEDVKKDAYTISEGMETAKVNCFNIVRLPNLKSRYLLGRRAAKRMSVLEKLLGKGNFDKVGSIAPLGKMRFSVSTLSLEEGLVSRMSTKNEVMEALNQEKTSLVAICGMAGVGKTTLVNQIADQVKFEKLFDDVAMATVSQSPDMRNVQNQLAEQLGLTISEQTNCLRAERIIMGAEIIVVNMLPEEEACKLFKEKVEGECKGLPLAIVVVARALRSNHTLESWNRALRQLRKDRMGNLKGVQDLVFSRIELSYNHLETAEAKYLLLLCSLFPEDHSIPIEDLVRYGQGLQLFQDTETLRDARDKVDMLVDELESSYLLLNDGEKEDYVKLHDVVREVCLSIASKAEHEFLVSNAGVGEKNSYTAISLISQDSNHNLLPFCKVYPRLMLLRLVFQFDWPFELGKLDLPKDSFLGMQALKVMDLNFFHIEFAVSWPSQMLRSLRTLCLDSCYLGAGMSSMLGQMMQLETLSLFASEIQDDRFPAEITWPSNLKLLDLRVESSLHPLPVGILSSLKKLEELYLGFHCQLQLGRDKEEERGCLKEISSISNLTCLQIDLCDLNLLLLLLQEFDTQKLSRFHIVVGKYGRKSSDLSRNYQFQNSFELYFSHDEPLDDLSSAEALKQMFDPKVTSIIKRAENLTLDLSGSSCLRNIVPHLGGNGFIYLKKLALIKGQYECLIDSAANPIARHVFENLVSMKLRDLKLNKIWYGFLPPWWFSQLQEVELNYVSALEFLWKGLIEPPSFCNLKSIEVRNCAQITTLFSQSKMKCLMKLQKLVAYDCKNLESIVLREESLKEEVSLPCLEILEINSPSDGPELLIGGKMASRSLDNLKSMHLYHGDSIRCIAKADTVSLLQNLQTLERWWGNMEFLIDFEGLKVPNMLSKMGLEILPKLESLNLFACPRLTHIWRNFPKGVRIFQSLRSIRVDYCPLNYLFHPPSVATMLISLEELKVRRCSKMCGVIGEEDEEVSQEDNAQQHDARKHGEIAQERISKEFVFLKLNSLWLEDLENLRSFGGSHWEDYEFKFPLLSKLFIMSCPKLKKLCSGNLDASLLKEVQTTPRAIENFEAPVDLKDTKICPHY
ncbi:disease resistance protein At4g27190-like [Coffea eugenioides]|uniref:disease resistance protein At4g27190-like n=1 Tax=Coffea eugenioides TaxID=49369 RepID=UPI000F60B25E|nr:disease resistance protein At4g27190-like [Coffea eugenioides]